MIEFEISTYLVTLLQKNLLSKNILLIGDSITAGFKTKELLSDLNITNEGISGLTSHLMLDYLTKEWFANNPELIFICIGTNDFAQGFLDEDILKNIKIICEKCREFSNESKIILTSIFPTLIGVVPEIVCFESLSRKMYLLVIKPV